MIMLECLTFLLFLSCAAESRLTPDSNQESIQRFNYSYIRIPLSTIVLCSLYSSSLHYRFCSTIIFSSPGGELLRQESKETAFSFEEGSIG